jgi:hypothetical protein
MICFKKTVHFKEYLLHGSFNKQIKTNKINILYVIAWHAGFYECAVSIEFDSKSMFSLKSVKL